MPWQKDALLNPSNIQPLSIYFSQKESSSQTTSSSSSSGSKISQGVLFFIVILAVIFFISGLLHLLVRFLMKHRPSLSFSQSSRNQEIPNSGAVVQRQLQQLFHLHDSGLDQAFIDALPVFSYKDIMGQKEPFDCAVCLCEFSDQDNLRLLPLCSHAFHIDCIDTWLLSNSTCPLCRGILFAPDFCVENPIFYFDDSRDEDGGGSGSLGITVSSGSKPAEDDAIVSDKRVFSVRLGKFWSTNNNVVEVEEKEIGETSNSNLDARRCYSMGSFQYVVGDSELQVALCPNGGGGGGNRGGVGGGGARRGRGGGGQNGNFPNDDGKRINMRSKGESFSVSKIWLWSKKDKFPSSANTSINNTSLPWTDRVLAA